MVKHILFDWGDTLMVDNPSYSGPMYHWPELKLCEGVKESLAQLAQEFSCHLATNAEDSSAEEIRLALQRGEIDGYISKIFCYRNLQSRKPSQEYFAAIQEALGCTKDEMVMVGDSFKKDISGAAKFGIAAIWLNSEPVYPLFLDSRITSIRKLAELRAALSN